MLMQAQSAKHLSTSSCCCPAGETTDQISARKLQHNWGAWLQQDSSDASEQTGACCGHHGSEHQCQEETGSSKELEDTAPSGKVSTCCSSIVKISRLPKTACHYICAAFPAAPVQMLCCPTASTTRHRILIVCRVLLTRTAV